MQRASSFRRSSGFVSPLEAIILFIIAKER